ncbi:ApeP family dehydratase [Inhella gelatinilytica]|nr:3-hydroxylacyl-ACP dehydratase [Inhella gelatinilytica]
MDAFVPHRGAMSWLDRLVEVGAEHAVAEATLRPDHLLVRDGGLSPSTGVEYMAQTVAAWAGAQRRAAEGAPTIGFLLGTRRYTCERDRFRVGETLCIRVQRLFQADNGLGQFEAQIEIGSECVARAHLNVFGPDDPAAFLRGETPT